MSDGRKEHSRKMRAARAAEDQATFLRDSLLTIQKQKREAAAALAAKEAAAKEAVQKRAADELAKASRPRKVLVSGDVNGNLAKLFSTVEGQMAKVGPFDMLFCVGSFLPDSMNDECASGMAKYLSGEKKAPLEVYFVDSGAALLHVAPQGKKLCENINYLGGYGVREINGLRVAFLSGQYNAEVYDVTDVDFVGNSFTSRAIEELQKMVLDDRKQRGIDVLLTSGWPANVECKIQDESSLPSVLEDGPPWQAACAQPLADLSLAVEPRYHIFGAADLFFQRLPFQALRKEHTCRCIGLGKVGSSGKQRKWLHALSLAPMRHMKLADLKQTLPNSTACPFEASRKRPNTDEGDQPAKRHAPSHDKVDSCSETVMAALLAGDCATFAGCMPRLQSAVIACGSAVPAKQSAAKPTEPEVQKSESTPSEAPSSITPASVFEETEGEPLSEEDLALKKAAEEWLSKPPVKGVVRYTFSAAGPLGVRLSRDVPPWILEVRDGTLAAKKAPRVPVGGIVRAVNGYELAEQRNERAIQALAKRPVVLDVEWPLDQGAPSVIRA